MNYNSILAILIVTLGVVITVRFILKSLEEEE
jgi:hypothetical protein